VRRLGLSNLQQIGRSTHCTPTRSAASAERLIAAEPSAASSQAARDFEERSSCARWGSGLAQLDAAAVRRVRVTMGLGSPWEVARFSRKPLVPPMAPRAASRVDTPRTALEVHCKGVPPRSASTCNRAHCAARGAWAPGRLFRVSARHLLAARRPGWRRCTLPDLRERSSAACFPVRTTTPRRYAIER